MDKRTGQAGFSLLEIMIVILIISVFVGITVPRMSKTVQQLQLRYSVQQLVQHMRYAQNRAIIKNAFFRLEFSDDFGRYWISHSDPQGQADGAYKRIKGPEGSDNTVASGVRVEAEQGYIQFYPDGQMDKRLVKLCLKEHCWIVSTKEQRGRILAYEQE